jgi:hypothetical protein
MIALAFFHAYLRGDPERFLSRIKRFVWVMENGKKTMLRVRALFLHYLCLGGIVKNTCQYLLAILRLLK